MPNPSDLTTNIANYANFSDLSALQLNGNALQSGSSLRLTPDLGNARGSVFLKNAIALTPSTSFSTQFQFQFGGTQGTNGADGMAFVIQGGTATAIGTAGGNLGYAGINNSMAIKFDTYQNSEYGDVNNNSVGLLLNGQMRSIAQSAVSLDLNSGAAINAWVEYSATTQRLNVYLSETTTKPGSAVLSETVDLRAKNAGTATMRIDRTGNLNLVSTIEYTTNNGTAIAPGDYASTVGTATFAIGESSKTITIPIVNDTTPEGTEVFGFNLGSAGNAVVGAALLYRNDLPIGVEWGALCYRCGEGLGGSVDL